jgi:4-hydroxy-tetrahydrodipicolinate reductase
MILVGAGQIGLDGVAAARDAGVGRPATVVDPDPLARDAAEAALGVPAFESLDDVDQAHELAFVAFSSKAAVVAPVVARLLASGAHVITTCEELADPTADDVDYLRSACRETGRSAVATGANPGFVMDRVPMLLAGGCRDVRSVSVVRRVDTRTRRSALVAKTGRGMTPADFSRAAESGAIGHVGLEASANALAAGLGWRVVGVTLSIEPIVDAGSVLGQDQRIRLVCEGGRSIQLALSMAWGLDDPGDRISIKGATSLDAQIEGGFPGDEGTTARMVNAARQVTALEPGFYGPIDLPVWV